MFLVGLLQFTNNGLGFQFFWRQAPIWNQESRGLMNGLTFCFVVLFARQFLRSHTTASRFHRIMLACVFAALCLAWYKWMSFAEDMEWWEWRGSMIIGALFWAVQVGTVWWLRGLYPHRRLIFVVTGIFWFIAMLTSIAGEVYASTFDRTMNAVIPLLSLCVVISAAFFIWRRGHTEGLMFLLSMSGATLGGIGEILLHIGVFPSTIITESFFKTGMAISAMMFSLPLGGRIAALTKRAHQLEVEALAAQKALTEARLEALQAKIHPHFLFNTLNSIASLISINPQKAEEAVIRLSKIFRYTLHRSTISRRGTVPLQEELEIVGMYVELERLRLAERLRYEVQIEGNIDNVVVPALTVQPLVENSIKYAIAPRATGGTLLLRISRTEPSLCVIVVQDDGPGIIQRNPESGHGLQSVRERLHLVFGAAASLEIEERQGVVVTLRLPVQQ